MGFAIPAFAVDEYGNYESGDQLLSQAQSAPEDRIVLPDATNVVTNGDFETGNLNGWTTFLTANGVLDPAVALFDTDGDSTATQSARFNVGRTPPSLGPLEGGGRPPRRRAADRARRHRQPLVRLAGRYGSRGRARQSGHCAPLA